MKRQRNNSIQDMSIRYKISMVVIGTLILILAVNLILFYSINIITRQMDDIYVGNVRLSELSDALDELQIGVTDYLNTKSTDSLDEYYRFQQNYQGLLESFEQGVTDNEMKLLERNIYYISQNYMKLLDITIDAKRGRNIEKYKNYYEQATRLYDYIKDFISSLNNRRFRSNTASYEVLSTAINYQEWVSIIALVVLAFFDVFLVIFVTGNITRPLHELSTEANKVSAGELDTVEVVPVHSMDEVGVVTIAFNEMVSSIPGYLERLRESVENEQLLKQKELMMEAHLKDAHLKYLQAQINPHFLFNTLNAGAQLAMLEKADKTYEYVQNVASFFRYNIVEKDEVTLDQEIRLVDTYMYILNVRFSGDIHFSKEIEDEKLLSLKLPGMILQPIVENSVNYGIRDMEGKGKICLSVYKVDDNVCISIYDNGVGMSKEKIEAILEDKPMPDEPVDVTAEDRKKGNGVGLRNVIERLKLYYNDENHFEIISSGRNEGTEVVITVPYREDGYVPDNVG